MQSKKGRHYELSEGYGERSRRIELFGRDIFFGAGRWWEFKPNRHWHDCEPPFEVLPYDKAIEFTIVTLLADGRGEEIDTLVINTTIALHLWATGKLTEDILLSAEEDDVGIRLRLPFGARRRKAVIYSDDNAPDVAAIYDREGKKVCHIPFAIVPDDQLSLA